MGDSIKTRVGGQLKEQGAKPEDLDGNGVHMLAAEDGKLHVLLKQSEGAPAVDALEATLETQDKTYQVKIGAAQGEPINLGKLGKWAIYEVEGINDKLPVGPADAPNVLHIFSAAAEGRAAGAKFFTSVDLAYAIGSVLKEDDIVVRGLPVKEGSERINPVLRRMISERLGVEVDDRASVELIRRAFDDFMGHRSLAEKSGIVSLGVSLGFVPTGPALPSINMYTGAEEEAAAPRKAGALSDGAKRYLESEGLLPEGRLTTPWAEQTIGELSERGGRDEVIAELRQIRLELKRKNAEAAESLWEDEPAAAADDGPKAKGTPLPKMNQGKFDKALRLRLAQLKEGLAGLGVSDQTIERAAREIVQATINPNDTGLILISGEANTAADRIEELVLQAIGGPRVVVSRDDIADKGQAGMYGLTPRADAILSSASTKRAMAGALHKVSVVIDEFQAAGSSEREPDLQTHARRVFAANLDQIARNSWVNVFSLAESGMSPVSMKGVVLVVRDRRDPKELEADLAGDPELKRLTTKLIQVERPEPEAAIASLLLDLKDAARTEGFLEPKIKIEPNLERALLGELDRISGEDAATYSATMLRIKRDLGSAIIEAASSHEGGSTFTLAFSDELINEREREGAVRGDVVRGAYQSFVAQVS